MAPHTSVEEARALEAATAATQMRSAALDLAKVTVGARNRQLLMPILLFLVERGVMTRGEMDEFLESPDLDTVVSRIHDHALKLEVERDRLYALVYLKSVTARPSGTGRRR